MDADTQGYWCEAPLLGLRGLAEGDGDAEDRVRRRLVVGPGRYWSPHHRLPFKSGNKGSACVSLTWRAASARPYLFDTGEERGSRGARGGANAGLQSFITHGDTRGGSAPSTEHSREGSD
jgi:hypothetical protein